MMIWIGIILAGAAILIGWAGHASSKFMRLLDGIAVVALFLFMAISAAGIVQTIADDTVFMTAIHALFLNPVFLAAGGYIFVYTLARMGLYSMR